jgi:hypothetical protein
MSAKEGRMDRLSSLKLAVLASLFLVLSSGIGVSAMPVGMELGIKAGVNSASCSDFETLFDPEEWGDYLPRAQKGSKTGGVFGVFLSYPLTGMISLQPEVLYSQAGCKRDFNVVMEDVAGRVETTASISYLEIPVLVNVAFMGNQMPSPFLCGGLSLGLKTSADYEMEVHAESYGDEYGAKLSYDVSDYVKGTNFSLVLGGGYALRQQQFSLMLEGRYTLGLTNIVERTGLIEVDEGDYIYLDEAKPRTVSVIAGISFR